MLTVVNVASELDVPFAVDHREVRQFLLAGDDRPRYRPTMLSSVPPRHDVEPFDFPKLSELRLITNPR